MNDKKRAAPRPRHDRGPLRTMFLLTSMPVGGAETLLANLVRRVDRERMVPEIGCLKERGPLGEELAREIPVHAHLLDHKFDLRVLGRLTRLLRDREIDALITVGCGDKMFWGRLAAWRGGLPVVAAALHSTGWPDGVGRLNRLLTQMTDAFIGVAAAHGQHLIHGEGFPARKVFVIPNGVDTGRFKPLGQAVAPLRQRLGLPVSGPVATIVAALRPEKNHRRFLQAAQRIHQRIPAAQFVIVGDGPTRADLESYAHTLGIQTVTHFLGTRSNIAEILQACDVFLLTSDNEAAPVSILEAMSTGLPVVAPRVGSIPEMVADGESGYLVERDPDQFANRTLAVLEDPRRAQQMGRAGRRHVLQSGSLEVMVNGYHDLIETIYDAKFDTTVPAPRPIAMGADCLNHPASVSSRFP